MKCPNCGELLPDNATTCAFCDADLTKRQVAPAEPGPHQPLVRPQTVFTQQIGGQQREAGGSAGAPSQAPVQVNVVVGQQPGPPQSQMAGAARPATGSGVLVLLLNFFFPGVGTIVAGNAARGVTQILLYYLIGVPLLLIAVGWFIMLGIWIWALVDSVTYMNRGYI